MLLKVDITDMMLLLVKLLFVVELSSLVKEDPSIPMPTHSKVKSIYSCCKFAIKVIPFFYRVAEPIVYKAHPSTKDGHSNFHSHLFLFFCFCFGIFFFFFF